MIELSLQKKLLFDTVEAALELVLDIDHGSITTLYGKSGAGKTSLLKMIAGLMTPEKGNITINGKIWYDSTKGINLPPQKREVGFVFQDYALFPNMTVKENLLFAQDKTGDSKRIRQLIDIIELGDLQHRRPGLLSGGQQQRVALARALVRKPQVLMLDEPLSALDYDMRQKLQQYIIQVHREYDLTTLLISHDISEILKMSDKMLIIDNGKQIAYGDSKEIFTRKNISAKFQFSGEVMSIEKQDFLYIVTILIGRDLVKVAVEGSDLENISVGDQVLVASKAFNPIIRKIR
ncbi:ATP-binding cassette domain-containing protein [Fulvivirga sp. M361]|uniref:ATP-binding cassette domain-containing protein n=1 Tax=Fulvivirga sp. M361 TaxID=2594266 RepID=UPI00117AE720|nr:ATP-binding cassette domain-containing protein [Fulvivirga sp. M361]TRX58463.1 ATP-binding cassette domain-containing protein [Fulvivirga sp. M361]